MIQKNEHEFSKLSSIIWQLTCLIISLVFIYLILINRSPNILRPISIALRTGFGLVIPFTVMAVYLSLRRERRFGDLLSSIIIMSLFALPLAGLWASGQTQSTVLSGLIPFYDAESYYIDALGLINGFKFSVFSARRPLFPSLLAVLLSWTNHNLMAALAILTAIAGYSCYLAAKEIRKTHGAEFATFVVIFLFLFFRAHSGISMSENLGLALGVLGFALLWQGAFNKNVIYLCAGLFTTTLALNARAGAFFMLPVLIIWTGWLLRGSKLVAWRPAFFAMLAVLLGFFLNLLLTRLVAVPAGVPFANFSYTLYGLASGGKSWAYVFEAHPEVLSIQEPEQSKRIYQLAIELIREQPLLAVKGALFNWKMLFSNSWYNIYSYIAGENWTVNLYVHWAIYLLGLTGIYAWVKDHTDPIKSLIMLSFFGVFISVPFLPPTDAYRMRPYAASIIILAALPALGLQFILERKKPHAQIESIAPQPFLSAPLIFSSLLISITLLGAIVIRSTAAAIPLKPLVCTPGNSDFVIARFDTGTYINIRKQGLPFLDWMPDFHSGQFRKNAHSLVAPQLIQWVTSLEPPATLFLTLDLQTNQKALVVLKTEILPINGLYYQFCGNFETDQSLSAYRIFYAREAIPLSP